MREKWTRKKVRGPKDGKPPKAPVQKWVPLEWLPAILFAVLTWGASAENAAEANILDYWNAT